MLYRMRVRLRNELKYPNLFFSVSKDSTRCTESIVGECSRRWHYDCETSAFLAIAALRIKLLDS